MTGSIKIAERDGVYVIKMAGDVRLTLCLSFDAYIEKLLRQPGFVSVVFDLSDVHAIDSTTLGLMAKFSIKSTQLHNEAPLVISNNPSITRILESMGFDDIFRMVDVGTLTSKTDSESKEIVMREANGEELAIKNKVLEAHQVLIEMNERNENAFRELVESLEASR